MEITAGLREAGFYNVLEALPELREQAAVMVAAAGTGSPPPRFEAFPSYIPAEPPHRRHEHVLVIDIGGTTTKVGLRLFDKTGGEQWLYLFEESNDYFKESGAQGNSAGLFCRKVAEHTAKALDSKGVELKSIEACGIVWSNPIENRREPGKGVFGVITKRAMYSKGEWFIADLQDGTDMGNLFLDALNDNGIKVRHIVLSNDTPLTMKALVGANAGMVASTGLNGTIVKTLAELGRGGDEPVICNGEMGRMPIPRRLLSRGDSLPEKAADEIEYLTSGGFLPFIFMNHIHVLAELGSCHLMQVSQWLRSRALPNEFNSADLSVLLYAPGDFLRRRSPAFPATPAILNALTELAREVFKRAAALCALTAGATVANQPKDRPLLIGLDSRLARDITRMSGA